MEAQKVPSGMVGCIQDNEFFQNIFQKLVIERPFLLINCINADLQKCTFVYRQTPYIYATIEIKCPLEVPLGISLNSSGDPGYGRNQMVSSVSVVYRAHQGLLGPWSNTLRLHCT